jgi:hypothetical protein
MDIFSFSSDPALKATFHSRRYDETGWLDSFAIEIEASDFKVTTRIQNPGYGFPPSQLFDELAESWEGWKGVKTWLSMESELEFEATCDLTGHITLNTRIPGHESGKWFTQAKVMIEAGQLRRLADEARRFFAKRDVSVID